MAAPKKGDEINPAAGIPSALPTPEDAEELTDAALASVTGGSTDVSSLAIDDYASTNLLEP